MKWKIQSIFLMVVVVLGLLPVSGVAGEKRKKIFISPSEDIWKTGHAEIVYQPGWLGFQLNFTKSKDGKVFHCNFNIPKTPALDVTYAATSSARNKSSGDWIKFSFMRGYALTFQWDSFQPFTLEIDIKNTKAVKRAEPPEGLHKKITLHFVNEASGENDLLVKPTHWDTIEPRAAESEIIDSASSHYRGKNSEIADWLQHLLILFVICVLAALGFLVYKQYQKRKRDSKGSMFENPDFPNLLKKEGFSKITPVIIDREKFINHNPNAASRHYVKFDCEQPLKLNIPHITGQENHMIRVGSFKFAANLSKKATFKIMSSEPRLFYFLTEDATKHQRAINLHKRDNRDYINEEYTIFVNPQKVKLLWQTKHYLIASWAFKNQPEEQITLPLEIVPPEQPAFTREAVAVPAVKNIHEKTATGSAAPGANLTEETRSYIDLLQQGKLTGKHISEWEERAERISAEAERKSRSSRQTEEKHQQETARLRRQLDELKLKQEKEKAKFKQVSTELKTTRQQFQDKEEQIKKCEIEFVRGTNMVTQLREELAEKEKKLAEKEKFIKSLKSRLKETPAAVIPTPAAVKKSPELTRLKKELQHEKIEKAQLKQDVKSERKQLLANARLLQEKYEAKEQELHRQRLAEKNKAQTELQEKNEIISQQAKNALKIQSQLEAQQQQTQALHRQLENRETADVELFLKNPAQKGEVHTKLVNALVVLTALLNDPKINSDAGPTIRPTTTRIAALLTQTNAKSDQSPTADKFMREVEKLRKNRLAPIIKFLEAGGAAYRQEIKKLKSCL